MAVSCMVWGRPIWGIMWWMAYAVLISVLLFAGVFVPRGLVYAMGWGFVFLVVVGGVRFCGGVGSVLFITRPQFMQTISPFVLSSLMFVLLHSEHCSASHMVCLLLL